MPFIIIFIILSLIVLFNPKSGYWDIYPILFPFIIIGSFLIFGKLIDIIDDLFGFERVIKISLFVLLIWLGFELLVSGISG